MTIDTKRLRALAEATQEVEAVGHVWHSYEGFHEDYDLDIRDAIYIAALDPQTVLALLDEIERLRDVNDRIGDHVTRHYLDMRMGREVLNIMAKHGGRAVTDAKEDQ